jgi:hypothetical protein
MKRLGPEQVHRNHLLASPPIMTEALNSVLPEDPTEDDAVTQLTRELCFEPAVYRDNEMPAFAEQLPHMLDHGIRQVALINAVMEDEALREDFPDWLDQKLLGQAALAADVGLSLVPTMEIRAVQHLGPRFMDEYLYHPDYGYGMAESRMDQTDEASLLLAAFIARHHALQAKRSYGPEWYNVGAHRRINTYFVDLMVTLEKPFDYIDDSFSRLNRDNQDYFEQVQTPHKKYTDTFHNVFCTHLGLSAAMIETDFDTTLPQRISKTVRNQIADSSPDGIGQVYRHLRPDLVQPNSDPLRLTEA